VTVKHAEKYNPKIVISPQSLKAVIRKKSLRVLINPEYYRRVLGIFSKFMKLNLTMKWTLKLSLQINNLPLRQRYSFAEKITCNEKKRAVYRTLDEYKQPHFRTFFCFLMIILG
jgi:hypothetical protein